MDVVEWRSGPGPIGVERCEVEGGGGGGGNDNEL